MIAAFGESTSTLEISYDQWRLFFETELAGGVTLPRFRFGIEPAVGGIDTISARTTTNIMC